MATQDELKQEAAIRAVEFVKSGMVVGLGSGSTAGFAVQRLAARIKAGELENIVGIPSSANTGRLAKKLGIPLTGFDEQPQIDINIDGADEVDPDLPCAWQLIIDRLERFEALERLEKICSCLG